MSTDAKRPRPIKNPPLERDEIVFSHPSEEEFARLLDYYRISWLYEPITFPLEWDGQGNILEAFSPDFYLVEQELYVELTTLRSRLMRIKHRKIRRLRELYPEISIRLWGRADFMRLLERFGLQDRSQALVGSSALEEQHANSE
ncbi:MAG: hypothetical protein JXA74_14365 [Anaerolineae bacterium]|nr:hypothetical protein [Anaerolineae bacterium]